ncbi:MAG: hypothetical protein LBM94_05725 [Propionibacteriaceae bacterium]|jgi:predicted transcriptional regulator|nr:hypothetical protein [Propionibacteriaceae bacterium]
MSEKVFTPEEVKRFEAGAAEAEAGYSVEFLRSRRAVGRPREIGTTAAVVVPVRLDPAKLAQVDALAGSAHTTRSQWIRDAVDRALADAA